MKKFTTRLLKPIIGGTFLLLIMVFQPLNDVQAQDPHFSQYWAAPLYLNPSFAGTTPQHRLVLNNRIQWPSLPKAYTTYALSYDLSKPNLNSGFGLLFSTDRAGEASLRSTSAGFIYNYLLQVQRKWVLAPSVYFGYGSRSLDYNRIVFGDQIEFGNTAAPTLDPLANQIENVNYFDSGAGLLFYSKKSWLGASYWHINRPNISFLDRQDRVPAKLTVHGGTRIELTNNWWEKGGKSYLTASFIYNRQGPFTQMDVGMNYHMDPIVVGLAFRGIPVTDNAIGNPNRDAIVFSSGLRFNMVHVVYSYDFTISELSVRSQGAHEISLEYRFNGGVNPKRVPKNMKFLPCPNYVPYDRTYKSNNKRPSR